MESFNSYVLIRPNFNPNRQEILEITPDNEINLSDETSYFQHRFPLIYRSLPSISVHITDDIKKVFKGQNLGVVIFGSKGSGKTYSLLNTPNSIIPMSITYILDYIARKNYTQHSIFLNMLYVHQNRIIDLLQIDYPNLKVRNDIFGISIPDAKGMLVKTPEKVVYCLRNEYEKAKLTDSVFYRGALVIAFTISLLTHSGKYKRARIVFTDISGFEDPSNKEQFRKLSDKIKGKTLIAESALTKLMGDCFPSNANFAVIGCIGSTM